MLKQKLTTVSAEQVLGILNQGNLLAKTITSKVYFDDAWNQILENIAEPMQNRGKIHFNEQKFNPKTMEWETKDPSAKSIRQPNRKRFAKKTSVTLLPKDGIMHLFKSLLEYRATVAILFNLTECDLRDQWRYLKQ